ncbi:hypothetical protein RJT34_31179 [Clitoria ternatea]|uniref:Uncharacterized protein n=1 Tax=Clitoria ternatea TaxID=43366 RepID=A0AAN9I2N9_CLITE
MRNFSKNKFLLCFRPVAHIDAMLESKVATHRATSCGFPCITVSDKHDIIKSFHHVSPKRTISRMIKAVFSETILNRRARSKNRFSHDSLGSKQSCSKYIETKTPESSTLSTSSSLGSTSSSSISSSQYENASNYYSTKEKRKEGNRGGPPEKQKRFEFYGIYLVLISLMFTVFWGKLFGIILTSTLLYLFSVWDSKYYCQKRLSSCPRRRQRACLDISSLLSKPR